MLPSSVRIVSRSSNSDIFLVLEYEQNERQLTLKWTAEVQAFIPVPSTQSLSSHHAEDLHVTEVEALYGALPLGEYHTALLYVTKATRVATLPGGHEVMGIDAMDVLLLPARSPPPPTSGSPQNLPPTPKPLGGGSDVPRATSPNAGVLPLSNKAVQSYLSLLKQFATAKDPHGGSYLYYSRTTRLDLPTINDVVNEALGIARHDRSLSEDSRSTPSSLFGLPLGHTAPTSSLFLWNGSHWRGGFPHPILCDDGDQQQQQYLGFLPSIVRGYIGETASELDEEDDKSMLHVLLVCRLSSQRAGTRYNRRGVDRTSGVTANFAETTQVVFTTTQQRVTSPTGPVASYTLLRGSVPCSWDQQADLTLKPAIRLDHNTIAADFGTHVSLLADLYRHQCSTIHCIDTLSRSRLEAPLSDAFSQAVKTFRAQVAEGESDPRAAALEMCYQRFDVGRNLHVHRRYADLQAAFLELFRGPVDRFGMNVWRQSDDSSSSPLHATEDEASSVAVWENTSAQSGLFRVNCLDCLDRTNLTQSMVCLEIFSTQLEVALGRSVEATDELETAVRGLWAQHGRALSQLYAGSVPHFLDILVDRRRSLWSARHEPFIALKRFVQQNFFDGEKQDAVSLVTGAHNTRPHRQGKVANPFDKRVTFFNRFLTAGFVISMCALVANGLVMVRFERYRLRFDFVAFQVLWTCLLGTVSYHIRKDPFGFTNYSVLH